MKIHIKMVLWAVVIAVFFTLLAWKGVMDTPDNVVSDKLYQRGSAQDGEIVMVGIDQRAFEELGPYSEWGRDIMAAAIDTLNQSEDCRPAAICVDVLYTGKSEEELDLWLAEAAGRYGNVIVACAAQYGTELVQGADDEYKLDTSVIQAVEYPYDELNASAVSASINAMLDSDGILRHHLLQVKISEQETIPSMALAAVEMYCDRHGLESPKLPPLSEQGFWYLPYSGEPGTFDESISLVDIINGEIPADYFAGKIVLIGPYAPALQDGYFTSINHAHQMYGIEYHANAVQAILRGDYKKEIGKGIQLLLLFLILTLAFLGFWKRRVLFSTLLWLALSGGWVFLCAGLYEKGLLLRVIWVPVGVSLIYIGCIAFNYISAALEKKKVTNTFKRYVDPSVIRELLKEKSDAIELGGKLTEISVLFVDIRGFTTMSEMLTAPQVVEILNQYLTLTTKCVMDNHGTLDKFVGDCTMAFWNAPLPQDDYVMNACKAAMAMVEGSKPLAEKLQKEYGRTVSFGVGVNVGPAVVGNIGAPMRMDYTAIGDTVNTAARLEANAPAGTVYISRAVADILKGRIEVTSLGDSIKLKGKKEGFEVLKLEKIL